MNDYVMIDLKNTRDRMRESGMSPLRSSQKYQALNATVERNTSVRQSQVSGGRSTGIKGLYESNQEDGIVKNTSNVFSTSELPNNEIAIVSSNASAAEDEDDLSNISDRSDLSEREVARLR